MHKIVSFFLIFPQSYHYFLNSPNFSPFFSFIFLISLHPSLYSLLSILYSLTKRAPSLLRGALFIYFFVAGAMFHTRLIFILYT